MNVQHAAVQAGAFRPAARLAALGVSPILALSREARLMREAGVEVIDLTVGEPDFDTPAPIKAAANRAIAAGRTKYTALVGADDLIDAVRERLRIEQGVEAKASQVICCSGAKQVIHNALAATLDPGDEVILPAPYWTSYADIVRLESGVPVAAAGAWSPQRGWRLDVERIEAAITPRTRWLILNTPGNPGGAVLDEAETAALAEVLDRRPHVWILTDDIYRRIVFDGAPPATLRARRPELADRTLIVDGVSKAHAMTGWRLGWGVGPESLIGAMTAVQSQTTSAPCSISQAAAVEALLGPQDDLERMVAAFRDRRDRTAARLNRIPGFQCPAPDGAFYLFPRVCDLLGRGEATDEGLARRLLKAGVAAVPGSAFGAPGHLRLSFAASQASLDAACDRIEAACAPLAA